jgi:hypothetical protein
MRIAEDLCVHQRQVIANLRLGMKARARVIEIHVPLLIETTVFGRPQLVDAEG